MDGCAPVQLSPANLHTDTGYCESPFPLINKTKRPDSLLPPTTLSAWKHKGIVIVQLWIPIPYHPGEGARDKHKSEGKVTLGKASISKQKSTQEKGENAIIDQ